MNAHRAVGFLAVALAASPAAALVNPYFTPRHLVDQSSVVLVVTLKADAGAKLLTCDVVEVLKGTEEDWKGPVKIDLNTSPLEPHAVEVARWVADKPNQTGLIFIGPKYKEDEQEGYSAPELAEAFLCSDGRWISLYKAEGGGLEVHLIDTRMHATWGGGTDMLLRCVRHVLADPQANIHVETPVKWAGKEKIAVMPGRVASATPVDLADGLTQTLFVACDQGDRLFAWDRGKGILADVTAERKLTSRSALAAWGDFDHDGRLDLASWDGKALTFHVQQADGTFKATPSGIGVEVTGEVFSMSSVGVGEDGRVGLVVGTRGWPLVATRDAGGKWSVRPLGGGDLPGGDKDKGRPGPCLVVDLDGDGQVDILQLFQNSSLLYQGVGVGRFAPPVVCDAATGPDYSDWRAEDIPPAPGRINACLGDWDHDGLLDVVTVADDRIRVWQNRGEFKFEECLAQCGSLGWISKPGAIACQPADFDNDGRCDLLLIYKEHMAPQLCYNRGYRWLGFAYPVDLESLQLLPAASDGCQAACLGDWDGDGIQDFAVIPRNGELWLFRGQAFAAGPKPAKGPERPPEPTPAQRGETGLVVRVRLPVNGPAGPVKVIGHIPNRCLGAWNVQPGHSAGFGREGPGPITLKWQFPGSQPRQAVVTLKDRPVEFTLSAAPR